MPVLTLSMQPIPPCPAPACWWWRPVSGLLLHWVLQLGAYSVGFFFFPPGYVALWDSKTPHRPSSERVSCCLQTSPPSWLPPQDGSLSLTLLPLFLSFIFCSTSFQREGVPSGCLVSSTSIQKLFCGSCSAFKWSFDEFVGEKVVSPLYSSAISGPPLRLLFWMLASFFTLLLHFHQEYLWFLFTFCH